MAAWEIKVWVSAIKTESAIIVFINRSSQGENETEAFTLRKHTPMSATPL